MYISGSVAGNVGDKPSNQFATRFQGFYLARRIVQCVMLRTTDDVDKRIELD